jgi:hypothetical protein
LSQPSTRAMPRFDGTRYFVVPSCCVMQYSRSMMREMCSAIVASVPDKHRRRPRPGVSKFARPARAYPGPSLTDAVLVHERDEVGLGQQTRLRRLALLKLTDVGYKCLADLEVRDGRRRPAVVRVDVEIVAREDDQAWKGVRPRTVSESASVQPSHDGRSAAPRTRGGEVLAGNLDLDCGCLALGVGRTAGKEATDDELVHAFLISDRRVGPGRRVDRRVRLVVLLTVARGTEAAVLEANSRGCKGVRPGRYETQRSTDPCAKVPQLPSFVCLPIRVAKSKALSYWSVSVRG